MNLRRLAGGYGVWKDEQGNVTGRTAIMTCCHCNGLVRLHDQHGQERNIELGFCSLCAAQTCPGCAKDPRCKPFEERLEEREGKRRLVSVIVGS